MILPTFDPMIFFILGLMIFLMLSLSKYAENHPALAFT